MDSYSWICGVTAWCNETFLLLAGATIYDSNGKTGCGAGNSLLIARNLNHCKMMWAGRLEIKRKTLPLFQWKVCDGWPCKRCSYELSADKEICVWDEVRTNCVVFFLVLLLQSIRKPIYSVKCVYTVVTLLLCIWRLLQKYVLCLLKSAIF
jgi:hypothetical protein